MKNRFISALLAGFMLLSFWQTCMAEEEAGAVELSASEKRVERFIKGMGLSDKISEEEIKPEQKMTRADFAVILSESLGLNVKEKGEQFFEEIFGETDNSNVLITEENMKKSQFTDVTEEHPAYTYINMVKTFGLMNGTSGTTFSPDSNITVIQATKALLTALNYSVVADMRGGYPNGYKETAEELKLYKGIDMGANDELDWITMQKLIYNALHSRVLEQTGYGIVDEFSDENSEMLMTKVFDIEIAEGVITDNGISSLTGKGTAGDNRIKINETTLNLTDETKYLKDLLGHSVVVYYYNEDSEKAFDVAYGATDEKEKSVNIKIEDFNAIDGNIITYYENEKSKRANLVSIPYVILNGEAVSEYDSSLFDFNDGDITLISWDNNKFNVIIVNTFEYCFVERINTENEIIYNKLRSNEEDNLNVINLKDYEFVSVKNEEGERVVLSDIKENDVLSVIRGKQSITLLIARKSIDDFNVKTISALLDGKKAIGDGETEYKIVEQFLNTAEKSELKINKKYILYLNRNGDVVWAETADATGEDSAAILTQCKMTDESGEEEYFIRVYAGNENFDRYVVEEKITLNGDRVKFADYTDYIDDYYGALIKYKINENNKIISITTPADYGDRSDRGLYRLNVPGKQLSYHIGTRGFGLNFFYGSACPTYTVPQDNENLNDIYAFEYNKAGFSDNTGYMVEGYVCELDKLEADYMVVKKETTGGGSFKSDAIVVESVTGAIDEDDMPLIKISGYGGAYEESVSYKELLVENDVKIVDSSFAPVTDFDVSNIEKGDIIRYAVNTKGNIDTINIAYDYSENTVQNTSTVQWQACVGYAYSLYGSNLRIAKDTLPEQIDFSGSDIQKVLCGYKAGNSKLVKIDTQSKKLNISEGTQEDIVTYLNTRSAGDYSKVVVLTFWDFNAYLIAVYN